MMSNDMRHAITGEPNLPQNVVSLLVLQEFALFQNFLLFFFFVFVFLLVLCLYTDGLFTSKSPLSFASISWRQRITEIDTMNKGD
jgi:hypothetical protein